MEYALLLSGLETVMGKSSKRARDNYAFHCPFCNHREKKLEVKLGTTEKGENPWECWVCKTRGRTIHSLLYQLKIPKEQTKSILVHVKKGKTTFYEKHEVLQLPKEFRSINDISESSFIGKKIKYYLKKRGITQTDIDRYNIGFCDKGEYSGRIIIPSYDENNKLNFFLGRTYEDSWMKYKNPSISKDLIIFENLINWDQPIILVEGVFDAIAVRRNSVPVLGKSLPSTLLRKIVSNKVQDIYIALDGDAMKQALSFSEKLLSAGKNVYLVDLKDKDPSDIGFEGFTEVVQQAQPLDLSSLLKYKILL